jgi:replicative superfamily II helicase
MLRKISEKKGTIFFIVPFVSLAEEKTNYFQHMWQDMNIGVRAYHGDENNLGNTLPNDVEVAVCTIEKANILLNQLLDENRESQLVMVVIDEIHM